jgi:fibro-slime domain-containing protein
MKIIPGMLKNSHGVVMVVAICVLLAITALGIGMITNASMSSTIARNYKNKIQSFYAADGQMSVIAQAVIDSTELNWTGGGGGGGGGCGAACTLLTIGSATASSGTAASAKDKDLGTRWESAASDPQWISVDLGSDRCTKTVVLDWETASAANYTIAGSSDGTTWTTLVTKTGMPSIQHRIDSLPGLTGTYRYIKMNGTVRSTGWGYSVWEFRVYGCDIGGGGGGGGGSFDTTRYEAEASTYVNCALTTEAASSGGKYLDGNAGANLTWTVPSAAGGSAHLDFAIRSPGTTRIMGVFVNNVKIGTVTTTTVRPTYAEAGVDATLVTGNNTIELRDSENADEPDIDYMDVVVSSAAVTSDTVPMGDYKVAWHISSRPGCTNCLNLRTTALKYNSKWGVIFQTPLNQYIERKSGQTTLIEHDVKRPVTFYDFHQDRTNPEFEVPHQAGQYGSYCAQKYCAGKPCVSGHCTPDPTNWENNSFKQMVAPHLDDDHKPQLGPHVHSNAYIKYWFRDYWNDPKGPHLTGDFTKPVYTNSTRVYHGCMADGGAELGANDSTYIPTNVGHDTSFKNVVIQDSVLLTWDAVRKVHKLDNSDWWPIDGKGFSTSAVENNWHASCECYGNYCGTRHNCAWTVEMQTTMVKIPHQYFKFSGDDDLWVFIDDTLVMDFGGLKNSGGDSVNTDDMPFLTDYKTYRFSMFYCERHSINQGVHIETNMLATTPMTTKQRAWKRDYGLVD